MAPTHSKPLLAHPFRRPGFDLTACLVTSTDARPRAHQLARLPSPDGLRQRICEEQLLGWCSVHFSQNMLVKWFIRWVTTLDAAHSLPDAKTPGTSSLGHTHRDQLNVFGLCLLSYSLGLRPTPPHC